MTYYRILPEWRKRFAPWDGELYLEVKEPDAIGYAFVDVNGRSTAIPIQNFERVDLEPDQPAEQGSG